MFSWRLLLATGEARYADEMERALYNAIAGSTSADGREFFYANPLASSGRDRRQPWHECACCPTNVVRLVASLEHYVATGDEHGIQLHLLAAATIEAEAAALEIATEYPWDGRVEITVRRPVEGFELALRVPGWCREATIEGSIVGPGYARLRRDWRDGDRVVFDLAMPPRLVAAHPRVDAVRGCAALARGPVVYCVEQADHEAPVEDLRLDPARPPTLNRDRLQGVARFASAAPDALYADYAPAPPANAETALIAIPYFRWANRGPGAMRVWIPI
jgi:DUF1680 family protein